MQVVDMQEQLEQPKPSSAVAVRGLSVASVLLLVLGVLGLLVVEPDGKDRVVGGTPLAAVLGAAERSSSQSARMSMSMELDMGGGGAGGLGGAPGMTMEGLVDFADRKLDFTMKAAELFELKMLSDGKDVYMKLPAQLLADADDAPPTPWISVPFDVLQESSLGGSGMSSDPTALFQLMQESGLLRDVVEVGRADARGTATTQYRATMDIRKFIEAYAGNMFGEDAPSGADMDEVVKAIGAPTMDIYVDDEGLVRREVVSMKITDPSGESSFSMGMTMTMDMYDYGVEFEVKPPPADQVTRYDSAEDVESVFGGD